MAVAFGNLPKPSAALGTKMRYYRFLVPRRTVAFDNLPKPFAALGTKMRYYRFLVPSPAEGFGKFAQTLCHA